MLTSEIVEIFAAEFGTIPSKVLYGRKKHFTHIRWAVVVFIVERYQARVGSGWDKGYNHAARHFDLHHTTVMNAVACYPQLMDTDPHYRRKVLSARALVEEKELATRSCIEYPAEKPKDKS